MEVDWDLHAVVRDFWPTTSSSSSTAATTTTPTTTTTAAAGASFSWPKNDNFNGFDFFPDPFLTRNESNVNNIQQLLNVPNNPLEFPKVPKPPPSLQRLPISPLSGIGGSQDPFLTRNESNVNSIQQRFNVPNNPLEFPKVPKPPPSLQSQPFSPLSVIEGLQDPPLNYHHHQQKQVNGKQQSFGVPRCTASNAQSARPKKRKNQMKKVFQVPADKVSSDAWCWRKYGQKPIKGSPYPRGYYKCSTLKECLARKQVERNKSDPNMFIVTYTGEHNHQAPTRRNSLAGSTRTKSTSPPAASPATEKTGDNDTEEDAFDSMIDDDFFEGLDELADPVTGDVFFPVV